MKKQVLFFCLAGCNACEFANPSRGKERKKKNPHPAMATGVDAKLLKSTKFPPEFNQKVDMQKVNVQVMKKYAPTPRQPQPVCHDQAFLS